MLPAGLLQASATDAVGVRWDVLIAGLALLVIYLVSRNRGAFTEAAGFTRGDVALVTLGSVAAQGLTVPLAPAGQAVLAINLGGALVPLLLIWRLAQRGYLVAWQVASGTAVVAAVTFQVVRVEPGLGAVVGFPAFLLPPVAALVVATALGLSEPARMGPLAFASGSLGTLIGADLLLLPAFLSIGETAAAGTALVIGGGGAFDLIFLSGALGLALGLIVGLIAHGPGHGQLEEGLGHPLRVPDPGRVLDRARTLPGLTPRERCLVEVARAEASLGRGEVAQAVEHANAAVQALLQAESPPVSQRLEATGHKALVARARTLEQATERARTGAPAWTTAVDVVEEAKGLAGELWGTVAGQVRLEVAR